MSGSRRVQRSIRVTVAIVVLLLAAAAVIAAVVTDQLVSAAAIAAVVAGFVAARIMHTEIVQTRQHNAQLRSEQAKAFAAALTEKQTEHTAFTAAMTTRVQAKDRVIRELNGTIRLAERRADEAEDRVKREARRANEAQVRLSELLDEVLMQQAVALGSDEMSEAGDLPTIVDLLAWEDRVNQSVVEDLRREA